MAKRMLIDSTHAEETRVVVLSGNRLDEFDFETSTKKQIKGNIYLAKVTRVEPSLQAAFVEYGGNRHGFLAFSEIHSDYYRIPVADRPGDMPSEMRQMLGREAPAGSSAPDIAPVAEEAGEDLPPQEGSHLLPSEGTAAPDFELSEDRHESHGIAPAPESAPPVSVLPERIGTPTLRDGTAPIEGGEADSTLPVSQSTLPTHEWQAAAAEEPPIEPATADASARPAPLDTTSAEAEATEVSEAVPVAASESGESLPLPPPPEPVETIGGDEIEEASRQRARRYRPYKIQEVIKRRQIMLVQVTKEERGSKGAALTTYLSLAGRYCVLMPNTDRGGGVSRKITNATDRKRLKELVDDLQVPDGMGVIVRTAGSERSKAEIKRDFEYLLRLWDEIRELTLKSTAPALIYEEGNLIKRSIRDLYARDIDEVIVEGDEGYRNAKAFMRMLMPSHAKRVHHYRDPTIPLLQRFQVESQIDAIHSPVVQLRTGAYIVINQTEALVAIDVNSGRATRERNIEETALKTNCEAAEEIARQLRLRDLAGLIVIDFIDMEEHRNQVAVERRLKEAMKHDRARIQVGRISAFGLLEMSRQRLRPSIVEASTQPCPHCGGTGHIRSTESTALHVLRAIEEEGMRRRSAEISVAAPSSVALYILNQKRAALSEIEHRYHFRVSITEDDTLIPPNLRLERLRAFTSAELTAMPPPIAQPSGFVEEEEEEGTEIGVEDTVGAAEPAHDLESEGEIAAQPAELRREEEDGHGRRRRRRRRRKGGEHARETRPTEEHHPDQWEPPLAAEGRGPALPPPGTDVLDAHGDFGIATEPLVEAPRTEGGENGDGERKRRRRGRRGGRRRRRGRGEAPGEAPLHAGGNGGERALGYAPAEQPAYPPIEERSSIPPRYDETSAQAAEIRPTAVVTQPEETTPPAPVPVTTAEPVSERRSEAEPAATAPSTPAEPRHDGGAVNVPPAITVTERPTNPKRGWWHRLTQG